MQDNKIKTAYESICKRAKSSRARKSLEVINEVCLEQLQSGAKDFSIANIGHLSEQRGGPKTQSIRNSTGELYRDLIAVYEESIEKPKIPVIRNKDAWVNDIPSPTARALVMDLLTQNSKLKGENDQLKADLLNCEVPIQLYTGKEGAPEPQQALPAKSKYLESEINALKSALDANNLRRRGLEISEHGAIINSSDGKVVFKPGFVSAIEKTLDVNGDN